MSNIDARARSTYRVFLMHSTDGSTYQKVVDIKDFPDLGGEPEMIETTTLSDSMQTYVLGIQSLDALTFTANYNVTDYTKIKELRAAGPGYFAVWFGKPGLDSSAVPDYQDGKFEWQGEIDAYPTGGGVNEPVNLGITVSPSTPIEFSPYESTLSLSGGSFDE